jgi:predicted AlkP superfamily phosphohydrolase/phosphomutase
MVKLYLIGMDSVPLWVLEELQNEEGMGVFCKLLRLGLIVGMESTMPPMTGPAWPSIYTGMPPSKHGVPDFFVMRENYTPELVYYDSVATPPFWMDICSRGGTALVITPATDITVPQYGNIDMITGFPLRARTNSAAIRKLMKKHSFYGEPDIEKHLKSGKMGLEEATGIFRDSIRKRITIMKELLKAKDYDFVYVCFTETDRLQHFVMNRKDRKKYLIPIYCEIAKAISLAVDDADRNSASLMLVSDHGMQPIKRKFLLNSWLIKNGYIDLNAGSDEIPAAGSSGLKNARYYIREAAIRSGLRRVYDRMPHSAKSAVFNILGRIAAPGSGEEASRIHLFDMDMQKTRAFAAISNDPVATIWINDSRFDAGIVSGTGKKRLKAELAKKLKSIRDEKGRKVISKVYDGAKYYSKTEKFIAPDLLVEAVEGTTIDIFGFARSGIFMAPEPPKSGDHQRHGIFGAYSRRIKGIRGRMCVLDVAPIALRIFGISRKLHRGAGRLQYNGKQ